MPKEISRLLVTVCAMFIFANPVEAKKQKHPKQVNQSRSHFRAKLGKGVSYVAENNQFKVQLNGWLQADTAFYNSDITPFTDGSAIRRGRLAIAAHLMRDWDFKAEYDFTNSNLNLGGFQDLYLRYSGFRRTTLMIGNLKETVGLEWQTSSKHATFMERSISTALLPPYHLGLVAKTHGKDWSLAGGVFGERLANGISSGNGWGGSGRVTYAPIHTKTEVIHLGMSGAYRELGDDSSNLRLSARPETNVEDVRLVNTSGIARVNDYTLLGLEAAAVRGPLALQGEYLRTFVNRNRGRNDLTFDGWYVYGSWFLTGESRHYSSKSGSFGRIKPQKKLDFKGGWGAVELAARFSQIDLTDDRIDGGRESDVTLGVNWYLNDYMRVMANYVFVMAKRKTDALSDNPEIFALRAQIEF